MKAFPASAHVNLANGITSLSIAASVGAVLLAIQGEVVPALLAGAITLPCDVLDGVVARRRKTASAFGAQLDSLSDAIGFGVLPAVLGYELGVQGVPALLLIAYVLSAIWRLAYFQQVGVHIGQDGREYFVGMPTTFAAALFYLTAAVSRWESGSLGATALVLFFSAMPFLMNGSFAFPKRGWHTRALWVFVPIAMATLLLRR